MGILGRILETYSALLDLQDDEVRKCGLLPFQFKRHPVSNLKSLHTEQARLSNEYD